MTELLVGLAIALGIAGVIIPVLPGSLLVIGAIAVWALVETSTTGWVTLAVATVLIGTAGVVKYAWPGRRMASAGIPRRSLIIGALTGIVGFVVIPLIGLPIGFIAGTYAAEYARTRASRPAWEATVEATKAAGLSILIELAGVLLAATAWLGGVVIAW